ncbi:MAG: hypothetical protein HC888_03695 [Candidatus Competibacteraceae bacterium]|nr:hypothetical protein [Candidatus Competibacteraceae bacterium]
MTPDEFKALQSKSDATLAMSQGLRELGEKLGRPVNVPGYGPAPVEDDPEALEKEAFTPGKWTQAVQKAVQKQLGSVAAATATALQEQSKQILKLDPQTSQYFSRFEGEIEKRVQQLPPQLRMRPDIYKTVYREVLSDNQSALIQEEAQKIADIAVKKALEEAGVGKGKGPAVYSESGNAPKPKPSTSTKIYLTADDRDDIMMSGLNPRDPDVVQAYLAQKARMKKR